MRHSLIVATAANKAEVSTGNLRTGASFDNLKASWGKKLSLGDFNTQLDVSYDYAGNKEFLKDATVTANQPPTSPPPASAPILGLSPDLGPQPPSFHSAMHRRKLRGMSVLCAAGRQPDGRQRRRCVPVLRGDKDLR